MVQRFAYGVDPKTGLLQYDEVFELAKKHKRN